MAFSVDYKVVARRFGQHDRRGGEDHERPLAVSEHSRILSPGFASNASTKRFTKDLLKGDIPATSQVSIL